jgi:AcrR family transcriptional regulator
MPTKTFFRLRDEKQELIMRAAIHEFVENGFSRAKTEDIAQKAGVSKGSLFQYFENKKELFLYCAKWSLSLFMKRIDDETHIGDKDVFEYFQHSTSRTALLREEQELVLFMQVVFNEPSLLDDSMKAMYDAGNIYTAKLIQNGKERGTVRTDLDDDLLIEYFYAVTERFKQRWMRLYLDEAGEPTEKTEQTIQKELSQMLKLLKNGMGC